MLVVGAERADAEARRVDAGRAQLGARAGARVAGEQAEHDVVARLERVEQLADARHDRAS